MPASIGGECHIFYAPDYAVRGVTKNDQAWIDDNTEAGIAGCGWKRPKSSPVQKVKKVKSAPQAVPSAKPAEHKKHWWQIILGDS